MITANTLHRIFQIWAGESSGTAFAIEVADRQYLVTAKHVINEERELRVTVLDEQRPLPSAGVWTSAVADVAVIALEHQLAPPLSVKFGQKGMVFSQSAYFLGYPYGITWHPDSARSMNRGFPLPLIKGAIVSGEIEAGPAHGLLVLDGHANPGFSGGPVVIVDPKTGDQQIVGIVIAHQADRVEVRNEQEEVIGAIRSNTGLILVENLQIALDAAKGMGNGAPVTPDGGRTPVL